MPILAHRQKIRLIDASSENANFPVSALLDTRLARIHATTSITSQYIEFSTREFLIEKIADTLEITAPDDIDIHPNGRWIAVVSNDVVYVYEFNETTGEIGDLIDSLAQGDDASDDYVGARFHPNGAFIAMVRNDSGAPARPIWQVWNFNATTGEFGARLAYPTTRTNDNDSDATGKFIAWLENGRALGVIFDATPFMNILPFNPTTGVISDKLSDPATLPAGQPRSIAFHPVITPSSSSNWFVVTHDTTPFVRAWPLTLDSSGVPTAIGTVLSNPATLPAGAGRDAQWSPSGAHIIVAHLTTPFASIYPWSSGWGAKLANPGTSLGATYTKVRWAASGDHIFFAGESAGAVLAYAFTGSAWGSRESFWDSPACADSPAIAVAPSLNWIAFCGATGTDRVEVFALNEDFDATPAAIRAIRLQRVNWTRLAQIRLRGGSVRDMTSGVLTDTTQVNAWNQSKITDDIYDAYQHHWTRILSSAISRDYWRLEIFDPTNTDTGFIASYLFAGPMIAPEHAVMLDDDYTPQDATTVDRTRGGVDFVNPKPIRGAWSGTFGAILREEALGDMRLLAALGKRVRLLWIPDEDDDLSIYIESMWCKPEREMQVIRRSRVVDPDTGVISGHYVINARFLEEL